jgi:hypothetical protein
MIVSRVPKQPKLKKVKAPQSPATVESSSLGIHTSHDAIRQRAFQLYESRGCLPDNDIQDWLHAEMQILER